MRFLCDHMLGTLAKWLRFLGYDTAYPGPLGDNEVGRMATSEARTLLTRDKELGGRIPGAVYVESDDPDAQLLQVARTFGLTAKDALTLCSVCNVPIEAATREEAKGRVPEGVHDRQREFWRCRQCGRFYWAGSHVEHVLAKVREVEARANESA